MSAQAYRPVSTPTPTATNDAPARQPSAMGSNAYANELLAQADPNGSVAALAAAGQSAPVPAELAQLRLSAVMKLDDLQHSARLAISRLESMIGTPDPLPWDAQLFVDLAEALGSDFGDAFIAAIAAAAPAGAVVGFAVGFAVEQGMDAAIGQLTSLMGPASLGDAAEEFPFALEVCLGDAFSFAREGACTIDDEGALRAFVEQFHGKGTAGLNEAFLDTALKMWVRYLGAIGSATAPAPPGPDYEHTLNIRFSLDGPSIRVCDARLPTLPEAGRAQLQRAGLDGVPMCLQGVGRSAAGIVIRVDGNGSVEDSSEQYGRTHLENLARARGIEGDEAWKEGMLILVDELRETPPAELGLTIEGEAGPIEGLLGGFGFGS